MVFAQIKDGIIQNTLMLNDTSILHLFSTNPATGVEYDYVLQIDVTYPRPGIGWTFDGIDFSPPDIETDSGSLRELSASMSVSTNNANYAPLNGMVCPNLNAGTYLVQFTGTFSTNVPLLSTPGILISIFANGVQQMASEMSQNNMTANSPFNMSTSIEVNIDDGQSIDLRWKNNGAGNTISCANRVLDIMRIA